MIQLTVYSGRHQGGTKEYHLYLFESAATKKHILVKRWGKTNSDGQVKVELGQGAGFHALDKALGERRSKGYDMRPNMSTSKFPTSQFPTMAEAIEYLPRVHQGCMSNAQVATLDPTHSSDRAAFDPLAEERKAKVAEMQRQVEEEKARQAQAETDALKSNPLFGMF